MTEEALGRIVKTDNVAKHVPDHEIEGFLARYKSGDYGSLRKNLREENAVIAERQQGVVVSAYSTKSLGRIHIVTSFTEKTTYIMLASDDELLCRVLGINVSL